MLQSIALIPALPACYWLQSVMALRQLKHAVSGLKRGGGPISSRLFDHDLICTTCDSCNRDAGHRARAPSHASYITSNGSHHYKWISTLCLVLCGQILLSAATWLLRDEWKVVSWSIRLAERLPDFIGLCIADYNVKQVFKARYVSPQCCTRLSCPRDRGTYPCLERRTIGAPAARSALASRHRSCC